MSSKLFARLGALRWPRALALSLIVGSGLLTACGGGGQIEPFRPTRVLAFGDEMSVIETDGRKYSINAFKQVTGTGGTLVDDPTTLDCTRSPIWIQSVASAFGLAFDRCLGTATVAGGQVRAQVGAKVADLPAQILGVQGEALGEKDLALVMIGMHDILEIYGEYPTLSRDTLLSQARARGRLLGRLINNLALSGPAVVVLTVPDIGLSPFALAENTNTGDPTRSALIADLVKVFNDNTSVELINDGRLIGLAYADIEIQNMVEFTDSYNLTNVTAAACKTTAPLPDCTTATLQDAVPPAAAPTATTWLWADNLRLSPAGHTRLGSLATNRAVNNPF
jgi:outer membrane lipase/esterase